MKHHFDITVCTPLFKQWDDKIGQRENHGDNFGGRGWKNRDWDRGRGVIKCFS